MIRRVLAGAAVAVLLSAGIVAAQGPRGRGDDFGIPRFTARLAEYLDLTDQQKAEAKKIFEAAREQAQPLREQLRDGRQAIHELIRSGDPQFDAKINDLAAKQASVTQQLIVIGAKSGAQFWSLLTPEQREKAQKLKRLFEPRGARRPRR